MLLKHFANFPILYYFPCLWHVCHCSKLILCVWDRNTLLFYLNENHSYVHVPF